MKVSKEELKKSFTTNTEAFLVNNVIMSALSISSLLVIASKYADHGLLSGTCCSPRAENSCRPISAWN
jgi:hypothetical protein